MRSDDTFFDSTADEYSHHRLDTMPVSQIACQKVSSYCTETLAQWLHGNDALLHTAINGCIENVVLRA